MSQTPPRSHGDIKGFSKGLEDIWGEVLAKLGQIIDNYEKVNRLMSILVLNMVRRTAALTLLNTKADGPLLDAGSGPGTMVETLVSVARNTGVSSRLLVAMDPLEAMLGRIPFSNEPWMERVRGVFEHPPFREGSFAGIMTSFALRDAYNYPRAVAMLSRLLMTGGRMVFLDISKPRNRLSQLILELYFTVTPVIMGALVMGYKGIRIYLSMRDTLRHYLPYDCFEHLFKRSGLIVATKRMFAGFVHIMVGEKPLHDKKLVTNLTGE